SEARILVHVDLRESHTSTRCAGELLEDRCDSSARAAPLGPEVHHHEALIRDQGLVEVLLREVDRCSVSHVLDFLLEKSTVTLTSRSHRRNFLPCQFDTSSC